MGIGPTSSSRCDTLEVVVIIFYPAQNSCTPPYKTPFIILSYFYTYHSPVYPQSFLCLFWSTEKMMEINGITFSKFPKFHNNDEN